MGDKPFTSLGGDPHHRDRRDSRLERRLQGLLLVRVAVAVLLLGGMPLVAGDQGGGYGGFTATTLTVLIVCTFASSAVFGGMLVAKKAVSASVGAQLAFDLLLATGFVYLSGAASSFFTILYGITILAAAIVASPQGVRLTAIAAVALYLSLSLAVALGWLPAPPDQSPAIYHVEGSQLGFVLLANLFGLALVGGLAGRLATRLDLADESLKQAEAFNRDIVRSLTSGLLTINADGQIQSANPAAAAMLHTTEEMLIGRPATDFLPPAGEEVGRSEGEGHRADGTPFPVGYTRAPLQNEGGTLVLFTDLTEIRSLREAAHRSERLTVLGRLSSALAHEIRNPLGSISGSVQMVRDAEGLEDEDRQLLDIVLGEVDRLNELVSQMLDVARPQELRRTTTDLHAVCEDVVTMARADEKFAGLSISVAGEGKASVDASRFRQLIWNLLKNAAEASPSGGAIQLDVQPIEDDLALTVSDEGPAVPEAARANLFDMFYSGHDHGIGLGLAVVKQIVDGHGGKIRVTSSDTGGARFEVRIPAKGSRTAATGTSVPTPSRQEAG